ncbi:MAG TPA: sensor histidine kinase [Actinocrinis sp.]|uniref:sensor histidine kinase n=1 Tax=Actinocrinis sp. TaxID=1920516 RepID=UPI002DDCEC2D|nr:sensor histidine kinase [Actinocrinis sp.]HEV2345848.1 sensor histidine kinase [Actinocrinis sp.]
MSDASLSTHGAPAASTPGFRHILYPYAGIRQYVVGVLSYLDQARAGGATVIVAVHEERHRLLREQLPDDGTVAFVDLAALGGNPGRLIPAWQDWIGRRGRDGAVHGVSESAWSGRTAAQLSELRYHEWLLNRAFAQAPAWSLLCPYDTNGQPPGAERTLARYHPLLWNGEASVAGQHYADEPYAFEPFEERHDLYDEMPYALGTLPTLRAYVYGWATVHGMSTQRVRDLVLAASEIASNSVRHGGGRGTLRAWVQDGSLVCEFHDTGVITDPLVGRIRPTASQLGGCGLWFTHQLCDLVEIRSDNHSGTRVRLHMDLRVDAKSRSAGEHQSKTADG